MIVNKGLDYKTNLKFKTWVNIFIKNKKFWKYIA